MFIWVEITGMVLVWGSKKIMPEFFQKSKNKYKKWWKIFGQKTSIIFYKKSKRLQL